jgi:RpiR family transcriptional regulator, carbohydrate utilization regulator
MKINAKTRWVPLSSAVPQPGRRAVASHTSAGSSDGPRPLLTYLKGVLNSLNPTERLIADCILADPERVITSSIAEIKSRSGASVGSIVGFCRRLGLKGFAEFKITLAQDLAQSGLPGMESPRGGSVAEKVFYCHAQSLIETLQANPASAFERAIEMLEKARRIEFFSIGLSYPVAYTAYSKFALLGLTASTEADSHMQLIKATQLRSGDVAFGISCSGATRETVQCLAVAKAKGAATISLTNAMNSPITACSDLCFYATPSEINYFQAPLASRVTQLAVIDALFVNLALKHRSRTSARLQQSRQELVKRRLT